METTFFEFTPKIIEHFTNPKNVGEMENADGFAQVGDPKCGDFINIWLRIKDEKIVDFKYKVFGCWGAISTTSVVSELALGKSLNEASLLTDDDVVRELGGIPENKQHCSLLGIHGLHMAIANFLVKDNHQKFISRIQFYRSRGYDIPEIRQKMVQHLKKLPSNAAILDVGTGKGHLALAMAQAGFHCTSIDISNEELYFAHLNAISYQVDELIHFHQMSANQLSFESNSFDAVVSASALHHLEQPEPVFQEMLRVCRPGGLILLSDLNENGQKLIARIHEEEDRVHQIIGMSVSEVHQWFQNQGYPVSSFSEKFEDIILIQV